MENKNKYSHLNYWGAGNIEMDDDVAKLFGEVVKNEENGVNNGNRESESY